MFTLPTGHPSHARVSSGISAGAEVVQPSTSVPARDSAKKTTTKRKSAAKKAPAAPTVVVDEVAPELDATPKDDSEE